MRGFPKMMCLLLTASLIVMLSICTLAYENEPYDFRGIKWGTRIGKLSGMALDLDGGDLKAYTKKDDDLKIGGAELSSLHYIFYKDQFYCVRIEFTGPSNFSRIRDEFIRMYGQPAGRQHQGRHYFWGGNIASITLDYDEFTETGELGYKYMPVHLQIDEEHKKPLTESAEESSGEPTPNRE